MDLTVHRSFFEKTSALSKELNKIEHDVKDKEHALITKIDSVIKKVNTLTKKSRKNTDLDKFIVDNIQQLSLGIQNWQKKVNTFNTNLEFRKDFGDSLLVFVYGKVKAGKSSLGNYVATGCESPTQDWLAHLPKILHKPDFFSEVINETFGENINHQTGFAVGAAETTSCIQGFRVPGFTWVDSPGLHSVTAENGDLAKQYADSADLIIYPMNSAQPARKTDLEELEKLIQANKRILLLITRSDDYDNDVNDDGEVIDTLVMKSNKDRNEQVAYVKAELDSICQQLEINNIDTDAISVSVKYAEQGKNSPDAIKESGIALFFEKMGNVIDSEALSLKKQVPEKNLQAFYTLLLAEDSELSISKINAPLHEAITQIQDLKSELCDKTTRIQNNIELTFSFELDALVEKFADEQDMKALVQAVEQFITKEIDAQYTPAIKHLCESAVNSMTTLASNLSLDSDLSFKNKTMQKEIDISTRRGAQGSGVGSVIGTAIGAFFGPVGMAVGGTIGGLAGGAAGIYMSSTETVNIVCGDNREEIKEKLQKIGKEAIEKGLSEYQKPLISNVFDPIKLTFQTLNQEIIELENYIKRQVKHV